MVLAKSDLEIASRYRNPYVDPLSLLEVGLLETVNDISQGLQNTG